MANVINWFEVATSDLNRAIGFYSAILGQEIKTQDFMGQELAFFPMDSMEGVGGNLMPPSPERKPSADGTVVYLNCEGKLDEVLGRVEAAGGKIIQPKVNIGEPGWIAIIKDTEGNSVGLHSFK